MLMPYRVALALVDDGWICRNDIIWLKPNPMPSSVKDRLNTTTERIFHFVKNKQYYYDLDAIREPHKEESVERNKYPYNSAGFQSTKCPREDREEDVVVGNGEGLRPKGKNPGDVIKAKGDKYEGRPEHSAGSRDWYWSEQRPNLPPKRELIEYLKKHKERAGLSYKEIDEKLDADGDTASHFFTDPDSEHGFSYPSKEDWVKLKKILDLDDKYDEQMTKTELVPVTDLGHPKGKNPGDVIEQTTEPFPEAHFAVYPPKLCEKPIKSSCPLKVCVECGEPYVRKTEKKTTFHSGSGRAGNPPNGKYGKDWEQARSGSYDIRMGPKTSINFKGWEKKCGCSADETKPGIVLDPMCGAGSTLVKAKQLGRRYIGIEISEEYAEIARNRLRLGDERYKQRKRKQRRLEREAGETAKLEAFCE